MKTEEIPYEPDLRIVSCLQTHEPDQRCADRIRARCHARVARRKRPDTVAPHAIVRSYRCILEPSLVTIACTVFLCEVLHRALLLYGF